MIVDINVAFEDWRAVEAIEQRLSEAAVRTLQASRKDLPENAELSVLLACDDVVRELNGRFRGKNAPTNVLSFPAGHAVCADDIPHALGDVVLAYETVAGEAREQNKPVINHACHLTVHGVLHLVGFSHDKEVPAQLMENVEIEVLEGLGIPNPYILDIDTIDDRTL